MIPWAVFLGVMLVAFLVNELVPVFSKRGITLTRQVQRWTKHIRVAAITIFLTVGLGGVAFLAYHFWWQ